MNCKRLTGRGQDVLVLTAEDDLHCPLCGANADHLTVRNSEDNND